MAIMWEVPETIEVAPSPMEVAWKMWLAETLTRAVVRAPRAGEAPTPTPRVVALKKVA